jgi:hypothetical protein
MQNHGWSNAQIAGGRAMSRLAGYPRRKVVGRKDETFTGNTTVNLALLECGHTYWDIGRAWNGRWAYCEKCPPKAKA